MKVYMVNITPCEFELVQKFEAAGIKSFNILAYDISVLVGQTLELTGKSIGVLAQESKETIFFHRYTEPVGGGPLILLECSESFINSVKRLPGVEATPEVRDDMPTERSPETYDYYMGIPHMPQTGNTPAPL